MTTPDLIIAVDFGMTCTGVAYASPSTVRQTPRVIQNWPGRSHRDENKVPTSLVYNLDSLRETETTVSSWGFQCNETESNDPTKILRHLFKTLLETQNLVKKNQELVLADNPTYSEADVTRWFEDYLRNIYRHIEQEMSRRNATRFWGTSTVVFIFSVPTTWSSHEMIERKFKGSLFRAGFGSGGTKHTVEVDLTEAEAAAVYTVDAGQSYKKGEVILICDAGGGTTDASIHKINSIGDRKIELDALVTVQGISTGSTEIDREFKLLAQERLQSQGFSQKDAGDLATIMMNGEEFQNNKCLFGDPESPSTREYALRIPELASEASSNSPRYHRRELLISCSEMGNFFDNQIREICNLIDSLLDRLKTSERYSLEKVVSKPSNELVLSVLSGGLGCSHYVRTQLVSRYSEVDEVNPSASRIEIVLADEPRLAVVKGLVINKLQRISHGRSVLRSRCCRESYGIVSDILWNKNHIGQRRDKNPLDGKYYAKDQIIWLVKQGEALSEDNPIQYTFYRLIDPREERGPWVDKIASSKLPPSQLPSHADPQNIHCRIISDLTQIPLREFKRKKFRLWSRSRDYYKLSYQVKVIIDPAYIRFELWRNDTNYTQDYPIEVKWGEAAMEKRENPAMYASR